MSLPGGLGNYGAYQNSQQNPYGLGPIGGRQFPTAQEAMEAMMNMQKEQMKNYVKTIRFTTERDMSKWSLGAQRQMVRNLWSE